MNRIRLVFLAPLIALWALAATPAPDHADVTLANLQGQQKRFADYRGKVLVVNFWATWCVPCQHEMPLFMDAQKNTETTAYRLSPFRWTMPQLARKSPALLRSANSPSQS